MTTLEYACRAITRSKTGWVDIKIAHMTTGTTIWWDAIVQRHIVFTAGKQYALRRPRTRADIHWNWTGMRALFPLAQLLKKRQCQALTIKVQNTRGQAIPCGMLLLIEDYPWLLDKTKKSLFAWFIASAPDELLRTERIGIPDPAGLGRILIDTALVASIHAGHEGRMWLHAAPSGGPDLLSFYSYKCSMPSVQKGYILPDGTESDGRHFYADETLAWQLVDSMTTARP